MAGRFIGFGVRLFGGGGELVGNSDAMTIAEIAERLTESGRRGFDLRLDAMNYLNLLDGYDWSGIYRMEDGRLVLDAYVGEPTEHTEIPVGKGVCGTAVAENRDVNVADVRELTNYLACSLKTRSELVVLIRDGEGEILGQIDIDSHTVERFGEEDESGLRQIGAILAERWIS